MRNLFVCIILPLLLFSCSKVDQITTTPEIELQSGEFTQDGDFVPVGGKLTFSVRANGGGQPITNLLAQRIIGDEVITESDQGMYLANEDFVYVVNAVKSLAEEELWRFTVMNANRDTASISLTVKLGEGTAYGTIKHFESVKIGMQNNTEYPNFLNLSTGEAYNAQTVEGKESTIDLLGFVYLTSGILSPTLSCPQYSSVPGFYPLVSSWSTRNSTLYDYNSVDNDLVNPYDFQTAANDSLLVVSYKPGNVSGNCKYCFTGKIIPFKTAQGKYGLIRVVHADITTEGYMELEIKVQE